MPMYIYSLIVPLTFNTIIAKTHFDLKIDKNEHYSPQYSSTKTKPCKVLSYRAFMIEVAAPVGISN